MTEAVNTKTQREQSNFQPISTLPKGKSLLIFLRDANGRDSTGKLFPDGTMLNGIDAPGQEATYHPTEWAYPHGMVVTEYENAPDVAELIQTIEECEGNV